MTMAVDKKEIAIKLSKKYKNIIITDRDEMLDKFKWDGKEFLPVVEEDRANLRENYDILAFFQRSTVLKKTGTMLIVCELPLNSNSKTIEGKFYND